MEDSMNVVSVVTPVAGDLKGLARLTRSLIRQTYPYWELVVVADDHRCYRSLLAGEGIKDPRLRFFWTPRVGSGLEVARGIGVYYARGSFLAPLDTHSACRPERLDRMVHMARNHGICASNLVCLDGAGAIESSLYPPGEGIRWLPQEVRATADATLDFVFSRKLLGASADAVGSYPRIDLDLIADGLPVPVLELVLQEKYRAAVPA